MGSVFQADIHTQGLPWPTGAITEPDTRFVFSFCLAEANDNRWLMSIDAVREDRVLYLPASASQGEWLDAQADLLQPAGMGLSWWFRHAHAAFELVERLGSCRIGPTLQARFVAAGGDLIAPPLQVANDMLARARQALQSQRLGLAFDIASRLLVAEGFRPRARQIRAQVLALLGCRVDALQELDRIRLLGDKALSPLPCTPPAGIPPLPAPYHAVALELQGLPLHYPAVENSLLRYVFRLDVPTAHPGLPDARLPWRIHLPQVAGSEADRSEADNPPCAGPLQPEYPEQAAWLAAHCPVQATEEGWTLSGEAAQEDFIAAVQNGLACSDRWGLLRRIHRAQTAPAV